MFKIKIKLHCCNVNLGAVLYWFETVGVLCIHISGQWKSTSDFFMIHMQKFINSMPNGCMKLIDWIECTVAQRLMFVKSAQCKWLWACFGDYRFGQLQGWHFLGLLSECRLYLGLLVVGSPWMNHISALLLFTVWWCFFFVCQCISSCLFWHLK